MRSMLGTILVTMSIIGDPDEIHVEKPVDYRGS
jgi:hypothetical protein